MTHSSISDWVRKISTIKRSSSIDGAASRGAMMATLGDAALLAVRADVSTRKDESMIGSTRTFQMTLSMVLLIPFAVLSATESTFDPRQFGAKGDGTTNDTASVQSAIDAAGKDGGTVRLDGGTFLCGTLTLKSGVTLQIVKGATLLGSAKFTDYQKNRWRALIRAKGQTGIAITGEGVINGQGEALAADVLRLVKAGTITDKLESNRPGEANRPQLIEFLDCTNVTVQGVTLKNSSCWVQSYINCDELLLDRVIVRSTAYWNNDGLDVMDCRHVKIRRCDIDSSDDGICLKSGDARRACEEILIEDCIIRSSASAFKLGTTSHGRFKHIKVRGLRIHDTFRSAIAIESVDGATIEDVEISDVVAKNTGNAIFIRLGHRKQSGQPGSIDGIRISDVNVEIPATAPDAGYPHSGPPPRGAHNLFPSSIAGLPGNRIQNVTFKNITISTAGGGRREVARVPLDKLAAIPEYAERYPEFSMFGELPAWGFYIRHAEGITFENIALHARNTDYRSALVLDDTKNIDLKNVRISPAGDEPIIVLSRSSDFRYQETQPPAGAKEFIRKY